MKRILLAAAFFAVTAPVFAADVAMSINVGQPGFYGRIDVGDYPQPQVLYRQPIMVEPMAVERPPIYMRVPPGHAKNWRKHCREYGACGERVLFVQDNWYNREYAPRYRENREARGDDHRGDGRGEHHGDDHGHGRNR